MVLSRTTNMYNSLVDPYLIDDLFNTLGVNFDSFNDNLPIEPYFNRFKRSFSDYIFTHYNNYTPSGYILIDGLNTEQRHFFYKNISELGLSFSKHQYDYIPKTKIITVYLPSTVHIPNHATYNNINRYTNIKPEIINFCNNVLSTLDNNVSSQLNIRTAYIPVNIKQYLTYYAIYYHRSTINLSNTLTPPPIRRMNNITSSITNLSHSRNSHNNPNNPPNNPNNRIRLELSDIIFDINHKITDSEFIDIMQKISQIKTS